MLDQSFSAENFRKILDIENRKGIYLVGDFYSEIAEINKSLKDINSGIRTLAKKGLEREEFIDERSKLNEQKETLIIKREQVLLEKLSNISSSVTAPDFRLRISADTTITSKPVYRTEYNLENILTLKQLQYNFRKLYKVKQSSRYSIISQLKSILDDGFPKIIVKTDIKEFFESIPHDNLLKKINDETLLTHLSRKFIRQILNEYKFISGSNKGVPRGIGISPYLTELYMRGIDSKIKTLSNVMYYARYVDDIIVIFSPEIDNTPRDYLTEIKNILLEEDLVMNQDNGKTKIIDLKDKTVIQKYSIEYLGYKFISGYKAPTNNSPSPHFPLILTISTRKKKKYAERLLKAFTLYQSKSKRNEKEARKLFVKRIRFLTGNTRLVNNKRNVVTGIYYTNSLVNVKTEFQILDRYFLSLIKKFALPPSLAIRIQRKYSFVVGFNPTLICKFNSIELNLIMKNWKK